MAALQKKRYKKRIECKRQSIRPGALESVVVANLLHQVGKCARELPGLAMLGA